MILDLVPNHTSDQHPWFIESRGSRSNPKRDWYIWREPGADGHPPNNWLSEFGGSAWEYDATTRQYYYHAFLAQQPDLNWRNPVVRRIIHEYEGALPASAWPNWVLGNHDRPRVASRVGPDQARIAAMLLLSLRGTPTLYYGDEIGMHQVAIAPDHVRDPFEKNVPGIGVGRDGCRTPMQWDATQYAGFSRSTPWLPLAADFRHENVVNLEADARSILNLYNALIGLRRKLPQLI